MTKLYDGSCPQLLEILTLHMGCSYISDLKFLSLEEKSFLSGKISRIPPEAATLWEWNNALQYLTDLSPAETAEEAREKLIAKLKTA